MFIKCPFGSSNGVGCSIPSTGGFGCSASVHSQMVLIHQLRAIFWKAMCLRTMKLFMTSNDIHGVKGLRGNMVTSVRSGFKPFKHLVLA